MSTYSAGETGSRNRDHIDVRTNRRDTVETKPAFKTTEIAVWALTVIGVLVAAAVTENLDGHDAWKYVTWLSIGYMISRGLAKAGSYAKDNDPRTADTSDGHRHDR
jgi:hypothetical protein